MPLKNDKNNENSLSRGSIINKEYDGVIQRTYTSLNTGTTQLKVLQILTPLLIVTLLK